ncbi:MAG TPA: hypothetical protein VMZ26_04120 [Pyrinomonadaceae bacterium]|nr:hypothetical protein [Pyrinomonadaceae bacterium]
MRAVFSKIGLIICVLSTSLVGGHGCSNAESKASAEIAKTAAAAETTASSAEPFGGGATIDIKPNSPADTVRAFYGHLRDKRFREALFLTNLRPAIEGLTDSELKEFQVDFESIAKYVPAQIKINGEIVSGGNASVTAKLPNKDLDKEEIQEIKLRKNGEVWVILTVDESAEKKIKQEGKNYFRELRIETHQDEAREMLDRVAKAQIAFSALNQGLYGDMDALVKASFLPEDIRSSESTGYTYSVSPSGDRKTYSAAAVPAVYGKSGRLSFRVELDADSQAHLTSRDEGAGKVK